MDKKILSHIKYKFAAIAGLHLDETSRLLELAEEIFLLGNGWKVHPERVKLWTPLTKVGIYNHGDGLARGNAVRYTKDLIGFSYF